MSAERSVSSIRLWHEAILWWSLAAFNLGLLVGIGAMLLDEWVG